MSDPRIDMLGRRHGRLVVTRHIGTKSIHNRIHFWECRCDCGSTVEINGTSLRCGETKSCGCLRRDNGRNAGYRTRTHGQSKTTTYAIWSSMQQRCTNPTRKDFARYGGRGVTLCQRWFHFDNFLSDMGQRPPGKSLDRIDNSRGYEPGNCRWVSAIAQQRNKTNNRLVSFNGVTQCVSAWADQIGMSSVSFHARLYRGWSAERAITTPIDKRYSHA